MVACIVKETGWTEIDKLSYDWESESEWQFEREIQRNEGKN